MYIQEANMGEHDRNLTDPEVRQVKLEQVYGSMPWLKVPEKQMFRAKVFKSGNSLALRLPAGLNLAAGMEMDLTVEDGVFFSFEPVNPPKRKFNIAKVAGSATSLQPIRDEDRAFEERRLEWEPSDLAGRPK
jgi:antitoxin VapB